ASHIFRANRAHEVTWVEVKDLPTDATWKFACIEGLDRSDRGFTSNEVAPKGLLAYGLWCNNTETGDHNSPRRYWHDGMNCGRTKGFGFPSKTTAIDRRPRRELRLVGCSRLR